MSNTLSAEGQKVDNFFLESVSLITSLYERWQDEKQYEKIEDYAAPLAPLAEKHGIKIDKMNKRPFGCTLSVNNRKFAITVNSRFAEWKAVK